MKFTINLTDTETGQRLPMAIETRFNATGAVIGLAIHVGGDDTEPIGVKAAGGKIWTHVRGQVESAADGDVVVRVEG